jgi:5-methylcytosine-specific restriction endonuclease McrA
MRRCGKRYATKEDALNSKKGRTGYYLPFICRCEGWHMKRLILKMRPPRKPARDTGPDAKVRAAVYTRDGFACVCCGTSIAGRPHSVGHRKRRSQGGGNEMPNLLTFLGLGRDAGDPDDHHARIDSRKDPHDAAKGYTVQSWQDPAGIPVMYSGEDGGFTAWLLPGGGLAFNGPEAGVA